MFLVKPISILLLIITGGGLFQFYTNLDGVKHSLFSDAKISIHTEDEHSENNLCKLTWHGNAIEWKADSWLEWKDFKGPLNTGHSDAVATSNTGFGYSFTNNKGELGGKTFAHFYCNGSWKQKGGLTDKVLRHEQTHFDICELYRRKFLAEITVLKSTNRFTKKEIRSLYRKMNQEFKTYQEEYDSDTVHSIDRFQQRLWNGRIQTELKKLDRYEGQKTF